MRNAKLWSLLLAAVLLCACALGVLFTGASAAGTYELNVGGAGEFATVEAALDSIAEVDLSAYESITVKLNGDVTETFEGDLLFDQQTIWKETGVMMPITVTGAHSLTLPVGVEDSPKKIANANDITFVGVTLPIRVKYVQIFAGSGHLTFDACSFGSGTKFNYRLYADNYTASVFDGWTEADYNVLKDADGHVNTSLTLKNADYPTNANYSVAAVGSSTDFEATVGSVKISANNTKTEVNWENATTTYAYARSGSNPVARSTVFLKNCDVKGYRAVGWANGTAVDEYTGDVVYKVEGGTYSEYGRLMNSCTLQKDTAEDKAPNAANGDVTLILDQCDPVASYLTNGNNFIQVSWGTTKFEGDFNLTYVDQHFSRTFFAHNSAGLTVEGDYNLTVDGLETASVEGCFAKIGGNVTQNVKRLEIIEHSTYKELKLLSCANFEGNITNTLTDCIIDYNGTGEYNFYLGNSAGNTMGGVNIQNTLENVDIIASKIILICGNNGGTLIGNVSNTVKAGSSFKSAYVGSGFNVTVKGSVSNTIQGNVTLEAAFYGAGYENDDTTVEKKITNRILKDEQGNEPSFLANSTKFSIYGAGHHANALGGVENIIEAGVFENIVQCGSFRPEPNTVFGKDENGYSVINRISGGTFKSYFFGGIASYKEAASEAGEIVATVAGSIYNEISGGTFSGSRVSLGNRFAALSENNPIVNKITGGVFNCVVFMASGGYGDSSGGSVASVSSTIEGGTFKKNVYAGGHGTANVTNSCVLTVLGGVFEKDLVAGSSGDVAYDVNFTITQTAGKELNLYGKVLDVDAFTGSGEIVNIGKNTNIACTTATGTVTLHQTEGWEGHEYFSTDNDSVTLTVTEENGVYGLYTLNTDHDFLYGGYTMEAATLILDQRVGVRVLLDPEKVEFYKDVFAYSVLKADGTEYLSGTQLEKWTDSATGTVYDSFVINGIGLSDFGLEFTVTASGLTPEVFSIDSIAERAEDVWSGDWKTFAIALRNLHAVYSNEQGVHDESLYALAEVTQTRTATRDENVVTSASVTLLMSDAVGVELNFALVEGYAQTLSVKVNGNPVENALTVEGQTGTAKVLFSAAYMTAPFTLEIVDESGAAVLTLTASIEKLASELADLDGAPTQENAQALLYYVQKTAAVA